MLVSSSLWHLVLSHPRHDRTIAEQESFLGLHFATTVSLYMHFSRETVLLTEKEQSLPNNLLVTNKNYVENHGSDMYLHFICVTNQWILTMEEGSEKIGGVGSIWLVTRCPPSRSLTPLPQQDRKRICDGKSSWVKTTTGRSLSNYHHGKRKLKLEKEQFFLFFFCQKIE